MFQVEGSLSYPGAAWRCFRLGLTETVVVLWWCGSGGAVVLWRSPPRGYKQATALCSYNTTTNTSHHTALAGCLNVTGRL